MGHIPGIRDRVSLNIFVLALMCVLLPLLGVKLAGHPFDEYLRFPPQAYPMNYPRYRQGIFIGLISLVIGACILWLKGYQHDRKMAETPAMHEQRPFSWWGWCALVMGICFWVLAWTRLKWFSPYQPYTFVFQWISLIIVVNALVQWRSGRCPMTDEPIFFLKLFAASAFMWWVFEYLNGFVNNWIYVDASYARKPLEYILFASMAFSTVLPGVYSTRTLLGTFSGLQRFLARGPALTLPKARAVYLGVLVAVSAAFFLISWYPRILYPVLWIGPFVGWLSMNRLLGIPSGLGGISKGRWDAILTWSLAALFCGIFWEMWNYHSMSKWTYQIPYLEVCKIFEMPLAGYAGFLAFGLECAMTVELIRGLSESRK
jgi:hypothetical protein